MIYSKIRQEYFIPQVEHTMYDYSEGQFHRYLLKDGKIPVGYVNLIDTQNGLKVSMIKNYNPECYRNFEVTADQIEVEHCLRKGLEADEITINSEAALNSHAFHTKIGKRYKELPEGSFKSYLIKTYGTADVNKIVQSIISTVKNIKDCHTEFLGKIPMYMPKDLILKYVEIIKKHPILRV